MDIEWENPIVLALIVIGAVIGIVIALGAIFLVNYGIKIVTG